MSVRVHGSITAVIPYVVVDRGNNALDMVPVCGFSQDEDHASYTLQPQRVGRDQWTRFTLQYLKN
jgi:hypothetical protein